MSPQTYKSTKTISCLFFMTSSNLCQDGAWVHVPSSPNPIYPNLPAPTSLQQFSELSEKLYPRL